MIIKMKIIKILCAGLKKCTDSSWLQPEHAYSNRGNLFFEQCATNKRYQKVHRRNHAHTHCQ